MINEIPEVCMVLDCSLKATKVKTWREHGRLFFAYRCWRHTSKGDQPIHSGQPKTFWEWKPKAPAKAIA